MRFPPILSPVQRPRLSPDTTPWGVDQSCVLALFPERGARWYDHSGRGNHGDITGAGWKSQGEYAHVLSFDGVDDYVDCGNEDSLKLNGPQSYEVLYNPDSLPADTNDVFIHWTGGDERSVMLSWGDKVRFTVVGLTFSISNASYMESNISRYTDPAMEAGKWWHIVCVWGGGSGKIYVNGELDKEDTTTGTPTDVTGNLEINNDASGQQFDGVIALVRIYSRALDSAEVLSLSRSWRV